MCPQSVLRERKWGNIYDMTAVKSAGLLIKLSPS